MVAFDDNQMGLFDPDPNKDLVEKYPTFFTGKPNGERLTKVVILAALGGTCAIGAGIIALRTSTEGLLAGIAFGGFALALGLASLINSYDTSCEIGEHLDNLGTDRLKAQKRAKTAREVPVIKEHDGALKEAEVIRAHHKKEGEAAANAVMRKFYHAVVKSSAVFGDGPATETGATQPEITETEKTATETSAAAPTPTSAEARADLAPSTNGHTDREVPAAMLLDGEV